MTDECRLTTFDNPYDPFDQFILWFLFDEEKTIVALLPDSGDRYYSTPLFTD